MESESLKSSIPAEVRARIIDAANQLFEESGGVRFPTQAEVRSRAKADMNSTSVVMRDWKRQQSAKPEPVAVAVPDQVLQAGREQLEAVWVVATELANASLNAAQESWVSERAELEGMRHELAVAYEAQALELDQVQGALKTAESEAESALGEVSQLKAALAEANHRADREADRVVEIERRAADLKEENQRVCEERDEVRQELKDARLAHLNEVKQLQDNAAAQIEKAKTDLATFQGRAQAVEAELTRQIEQATSQLLDCKESFATAQAEAKNAGQVVGREVARAAALEVEAGRAKEDAATAREAVAHLKGQLEAVQAQNSVLLAKLPSVTQQKRPAPKSDKPS